jgi:hypothetical protein
MSDADEVVGMAEINLGIDFGFGRRVEEVRDEWKWVLIFFGDFVEAMIVYTGRESHLSFLMKRTGVP